MVTSILKYFFRYLGIGVINTIIGHGTIFGLMFAGVNPFVSNGVGYSVGITVSYVLNRVWNFKSTIPHKKAYPRFAGLLFLAYLVNVVVLYMGINLLAINKYIAQIISRSLLYRNWILRKPLYRL